MSRDDFVKCPLTISLKGIWKLLKNKDFKRYLKLEVVRFKPYNGERERCNSPMSVYDIDTLIIESLTRMIEMLWSINFFFNYYWNYYNHTLTFMGYVGKNI